jgi:hypothetical protein
MTQPGEGTEITEGVDIHTTAGKVADLEHKLQEAVHAGSERAIEICQGYSRTRLCPRLLVAISGEGSVPERLLVLLEAYGMRRRPG